MAVIRYLEVVQSSLGLQAVASTGDVPMAEAQRELCLGRAKWDKNILSKPFAAHDLSLITTLAAAATSLDALEIFNEPTGKIFEVSIAADPEPNLPRRYRIVAKGVLVPDADNIILPPDHDATANNRVLLRIA